MKVRIYQMRLCEDTIPFVYEDLPVLLNRCCNRIPAELYRKEYGGEVDAKTLEDIFYIFNEQHPADYAARSLSISDVVEVIEDNQSSFYYCRVLGFQRIDFDASLVKEETD